MKNKIIYNIIYGFAYIHAILPLRVLYVLSDILWPLMYYIVRYRRKLVRKNLNASFPEKTPTEIIRIEKQFYRHFCSYIVETIKIFHISDQEMQRRMKFTNMELLHPYIKEGHSFIVMLGHYGNWEWITSFGLSLPQNLFVSQVYRKLKNKPFDRLMLKLRTRFGTINIEKNDTLRTIVKLMRSDKQAVIGFISDQKASRNNIHYWTTFLNQDTSVLTGAERIARQTGFLVAYMDVKRIKRGYYEAEMKLISDNPKSTEENEITEKYIRMMEQTIMRDPAYWLWTHNRWKFKRNNLPE